MNSFVLTCPNCATRYRADPSSLGESGRDVRCARCGETWFAMPPDIIDTLVTDPDALAHQDNVAHSQTVQTRQAGGRAATARAFAPVPKSQPRTEQRPSLVAKAAPDTSPVTSPDPVADSSEEERSETTPEIVSADRPEPDVPPVSDLPPSPSDNVEPVTHVPLDDQSRTNPSRIDPDMDDVTPSPVGADVMMRDLADSQKLARRRRTIQIIWAIPLVLVIIAALAAWMNRQAIVNRIPQMASVYQFLGSEVRAGGLEIDPPEATAIMLEGVPTIRVQGSVRNLTNEALPVPLIELTLHDAAGQGLTQWYVEMGQVPLGGGEREVFTSEYPNPPDAAVGLRYRFVRNTG